MSEAPSPEFVALQRAVAGRYSLHRELGRGGMGVVLLAEARTAAGLSHPHIRARREVTEIAPERTPV